MKTIYYYNSPIGILKLVCSKNSLEEIVFVDNAEVNLNESSAILSTCKEQLDEYFKGKLQEFTIPLSFIRGTPFQQNVWTCLQKIPYGKTMSYKDIATLVGNPKAVRAVGGANNKNPLPLVIPCHRVIGSDGKLVGYAGGLDKKSFLLKMEKK
jgi:methylated-DNA-[protein]-cysteine S-methyltransferase